MITPSLEYKAAIQQNMRGSMEFEAVISVENIEFKEAAVLSDNGHLSFSDIQEITTDRRPRIINTTAETNMYLLNGTQELLPSAPEYQGFVSSFVSGDIPLVETDSEEIVYDRHTFINKPKIKIETDNLSYDLSGIRIEFDTFNNDYPTDFIINYYFKDILVRSSVVSGNTGSIYSTEERVNSLNAIELIFDRMHNANRRLRVTGIYFGITRMFTAETQSGIINMSHKTMIHPLMKEIPLNELQFEIRDADKEYNPEDPRSVWRYTHSGQTMLFNYFFNYYSEEHQKWIREKIPGGKFYLKNPPTTQGENVRFQATGLLQTLTMLYTEGSYHPLGRTYYDLFSDVLTFAGIPKDKDGKNIWILDERLKAYKCYLPLPIKRCAELIQILCQNTASIVFEDTDGYMHIQLSETKIANNPLRLTTAYSYPNYDPQLPRLRTLLLTRHSVSVSGEVSELNASTHFIDGIKELFISYEASTEQKATVTGGLLLSVKYFAYHCLLTVSADSSMISVTITGKKLIFAKAQLTYGANTQGDDAPVEMELLSDDSLCNALFLVYSKYLQETKRYKFEYLGDPARRSNDIFPIDTRFITQMPAMALSSEYSFDAGSRGVLELKNFGSYTAFYRTGTIRTRQVKIRAIRN